MSNTANCLTLLTAWWLSSSRCQRPFGLATSAQRPGVLPLQQWASAVWRSNGKSFQRALPFGTEPGAGHFGQRNLLIALPKAHSCLSKNTPHDGLLDLLCLHHLWFRSHSCHVLNPINPASPSTCKASSCSPAETCGRSGILWPVRCISWLKATRKIRKHCWAHMLLGQDLQPWATQVQGWTCSRIDRHVRK